MKIKLLLLTMLFMSLTSFAQSPEFEVYTGMIVPKGNGVGYMIGLNFLPSLHQIDKESVEGPMDREWLNKMIFGVEFSGYNRKLDNIPLKNIVIDPTTTVTTDTPDCHCESETYAGFVRADGYDITQEVKGVSLNFGVEIYRGWFVTSGITGYQRKLKYNGQTFDTSRPFYIDAGVKKFFHIGNVILSPMLKFNMVTTSFGIGFSYD